MNKSQLLDLIHSNARHSDFGKLLVWFTTPLIYHPSIQLNDRVSLGWQPQIKLHPHYKGCVAVKRNLWRIRVPLENERTKNIVQAALIKSVEEFHDKWMYDLWSFNCEHWAVGVATGEASSDQLKHYNKVITKCVPKRMCSGVHTVNTEVSALLNTSNL